MTPSKSGRDTGDPEPCEACDGKTCSEDGLPLIKTGEYVRAIEDHHALIASLRADIELMKVINEPFLGNLNRTRKERDEVRAALRDLVYQSEWFESLAEEGSDVWKAYAEARRVLGRARVRRMDKERK